MSELLEKQIKFTLMIAELIGYAYRSGYQLTFGDAYRDPRVHGDFGEKKSYAAAKSVHKLRLAVDFNLFKHGKLLTGIQAEEAHHDLHDYWDMLGGAPRIEKDLNHYSMEMYGVR